MEELNQKTSSGGSNGVEQLKLLMHLWSHIFAYLQSTSLKCAIELGIPDAVHNHGGRSVSLSQLLSDLSLPPSKSASLRRLMRMLTNAGFFTIIPNSAIGAIDSDRHEDGYVLAPPSTLLITGNNSATDLSPFVAFMFNNFLVQPSFSLSSWFHSDDPNKPTPFHALFGTDIWDLSSRELELSSAINSAMACDSQFMMDILLKDHGNDVFHDLTSLVDVGGGHGAVANAIAAKFPHIKCSVLDLPHVVSAAKSDCGTVDFIAGDMFHSVPSADAVLLKWVLHDWNDQDTVKILKNCKKAISSRVIIIDLVVGSSFEEVTSKVELSFDMLMMAVVGGNERTEQEWGKVFMDAGFSGYKILPILGVRSVIEVYP